MTIYNGQRGTVDDGLELLVETSWNERRRSYAVQLVLQAQPIARMDQAAAFKHAAAVLAVAQHAEHDGALLRQMIEHLGMPAEVAAHTVRTLRETRRVPSKADTAPLVLAPVVTEAMRAGVDIHHRGEHLGRWTLRDARAHAQYLLEAVEAARLDTAYRRYLVDVVGVGDGSASAAVYGLQDFRPDPTT